MNANQSFILCATDFSPQATAAASAAAKIALQRREKLQIVHVTDSPRPSVLAVLRSHLESEAERVRRRGVEVEADLLDGSDAAATLVAHARKEIPSLIVVGRRPKGMVDRWAVGSFSEKVAESAPTPTLVVQDPSVFESWDWTKAHLRILLALDFYSSSDVVLRWAKAFQRAGPCDLAACHVNWRTPAFDEQTSEFVPRNSTQAQRQLERDLRKKLRDQLGDDSVETIVRPYFGDPGPCIVAIAEEKKAQVIAIGAHQRHGLARLARFSTSREVLHQAKVNVICIPVSTGFDPREAHIPDFRRVLVTTDFSDLGNAAVPYACAACCIGGTVKLVHVAGAPRGVRRRRNDGRLAELAEQLRALVPQEASVRAEEFEVAVLEGRDVAKAICDEAERFGADAVCIASHGRGASRALHGSVSKAVLKQLRRPLLVIRRPEG